MATLYVVPQSEIEAALKAHPDQVHKLSTESLKGRVEILIRTPTRGEHRRFMAENREVKTRGVALENLLRSILIAPSREQFTGILDALPGLCEEFADPIASVMGITQTAAIEKL